MKLIVAVDKKTGGIGIDNGIPWRIEHDMRFFKKTTTGNVVIMGKNTFNSLPGGKPLPNRVNIVVSTSLYKEITTDKSVLITKDLEQTIPFSNVKHGMDAFIIGGPGLYTEALEKGLIDCMYITEIESDITEFDTFLDLKPFMNQFPNKEILGGGMLGLNKLSYTINKYTK